MEFSASYDKRPLDILHTVTLFQVVHINYLIWDEVRINKVYCIYTLYYLIKLRYFHQIKSCLSESPLPS